MARLSSLPALRRVALAFLVAAGLAACVSKISPDNFARIQPGMTQQEVIAILGNPSETTSISLGSLSGTSTTWTDGKTTISIQFLNDKVQAKQLSKSSDKPAPVK